MALIVTCRDSAGRVLTASGGGTSSPYGSVADGSLGGKAGALASLGRAGFRVPDWFVVLPEAYRRSLGFRQEEIPAEVAPEVRTQVEAEVRRLFPGARSLAVRSSAEGEDGNQHSFAGQFESFLFVRPEDVCADIVRVWRSGFSPRVRAYRRENKLPLPGPPPAVLVQRMVEPVVAGVAFGADPVSGRRGVAVVSALRGMGTALVSGECDGDYFEVDREGAILKRRIADKTGAPALTDAQVREVAGLARLAGRHFGRPQDIEWAIEGETCWLLQSRPITALTGLADPDGRLNLWDNSNIAESYSGVTTPLTYSFARYAYQEVYQQFCRIMGVPERTIAANSGVFRRMLGLVRGRIYYNLINWYRLLSMLPGFAMNRKFMEQMMGVKKGIPPRVLAEFSTPTDRLARLRDGVRFAGTLAGSLGNYLRLPRKIELFYRHLDEVLRPTPLALADMDTDELARLYRDIEGRLLARWDVPLINDFFAMIFYGLLRQLGETWCADPSGTLQNDLLCGEGGMISAEPAERVRAMASLAARSPETTRALCEGGLGEIGAALKAQPELERLSRDYLAKFGERCLEELKLETLTLNDDPTVLWRSIGRLARGGPPHAKGSHVEVEIRRAAEERVRRALAGRPIRRAVFNWILNQARRLVRNRENLRFERTRVFGRARVLFVELGRRFYALDALERPRDIFFLTVEEIFGFIDGATATADLVALVALRKAEFERYRAHPAPADRFETYGVVNSGNDFKAEGAPAAASDAESLSGLGCCSGVVRGRARVILDPRDAHLEPGEILVAPRTDPGWIMLFPSAAGLLIEHGSLLSHSAIIAREMGIAAIVSASGATRWARTGEWVEIDGRTGIARKIRAPAPQEPSDAK